MTGVREGELLAFKTTVAAAVVEPAAQGLTEQLSPAVQPREPTSEWEGMAAPG